ncbi:unnamed protein product [Urochloa humidicola]
MEQNYLVPSWVMVTKKKYFTIDDLAEKFTINWVNKSGAVFDATRLKQEGAHKFLSREIIFNSRKELNSVLQETHGD